jgi:outer membrane protein assembly factor BamB
VGDTIYTLGDLEEASQLLALEREGGRIRWKTKMGKAGGGGGYPGPRCTPTVDGALVIALNQFGDLIAAETATGKEIWRKNLESDFGGKMMSGWGYAESPLVDGDRVICSPGGAQGTLVALQKQTGAVLWQSKDWQDPAAYSSVIRAVVAGQPQYIQLTGESVAGVAADTGKLLWRAERKGRTAVIPTPIFHQNQVYVSSGYGVGCNLFTLTADPGTFQVREAWPANKVMVNHHGGVILVRDHLYGYSEGKGWVCQEFASGKAVWEEKRQLGKGSIAYADGRFYLRAEGGAGAVVLIEATPEGYREKGRFDQPDRSDKNSWPHPVICQGRLYLRDQDLLLCYDIQAK